MSQHYNSSYNYNPQHRSRSAPQPRERATNTKKTLSPEILIKPPTDSITSCATQLVRTKTSKSRNLTKAYLSKTNLVNPNPLGDPAINMAVPVEGGKQNRGVVTIGRKMRGRHLKHTRIRLEDDMDLEDARMVNIEHERGPWCCEYCYDAAVNAHNDDLENVEYLRQVFPEVRDIAKREDYIGEAVSDEDLKAMGLLYDSEEAEQVMQALNEKTLYTYTSLVLPRSATVYESDSESDSDLDEVWELVGGKRSPVEEGSEWDVMSEF
ncbi:hypothetical protein AA313_de0202007 [Arthrobotrys entomopaga]|nr:hypothetical protein AA313_de0202007 [Arthrobotrys entomopaga]